MDRFHDILNNLSLAAKKAFEANKATLLPVPTVTVEPAQPKPVIKEELVDKEHNDKVAEEAKKKIEELRPSSTDNIVPTTAEVSMLDNDKTSVFDLVTTNDNSDDDMESEDDSSIEDHKLELYQMVLVLLRSIKVRVKGILNAAVDEMNPDVQKNLTEAWLQGKIAVIADQVQAVHDFVMFSKESDDMTTEAKNKLLRTETKTSETDDNNQSPSLVDKEKEILAENRPGLWDNIRKKREKEGKNYRPAKPGDKDRPDPDQWKKLTK